MSEQIYLFLGIAKKANRLVVGEGSCEINLRSGKTKLVIVAEDSSDNTKKKFIDMCNYRKIAIEHFCLKEKLGNYLGKGDIAVLCINDEGIAKKLQQMISNLSLKPGGF